MFQEQLMGNKSIEDVAGVHDELRKMLDNALSEVIHDSTQPKTGALLQEHLDNGGKRLRGILCVEAGLCQSVPLEQAIVLGAAVELLHNASLIHDDIQDGDTHRRGKPTLWKRYGLPQAINIGDYAMLLPNKAIEAIEGIPDSMRWNLSMAFSRYSYKTIHGQVGEIEFPNEKGWSWSSYLKVIEEKTGTLFGLPVECASILAGVELEEARRIASAFVDLGVLFQLQDDVLDLYGSKGRTVRGCDLYEGKVSGLVVSHLELYPDEEGALRELLSAPREATQADEVEKWIQRFKNGGALEQTILRIKRMKSRVESNPIFLDYPELLVLAQRLANKLLGPIAEVICGVDQGLENQT